ERFRLEARSAARLHHTHIVPVYGVGQHEGLPYYAMQYIAGHGLDAVLEDVRRLRAGRIATGDPVSDADEGSVAVARSLLTGWFGAPRAKEGEGQAASRAQSFGATSAQGDLTADAPATPRPASRPKPSATHGSVLSPPTVSDYHRTVARIGL